MQARRRAAVVVGLAVAFGLASTRQLLTRVTWPNDAPFHEAMVRWSAGRIERGHLPMDGWFPTLSGGLAQFRAYQSLPHQLTAAVGTVIGVDPAMRLTTWLLVGGWPIAVYVGARNLGLERRPAAVAAAAAPLLRSPVGYGYEHTSYLWSGNGLWSQLWGMWGLPLGLGWSARAVRDGRATGRAVAANAFTVAAHLPTAWFGLLAIGLWPLARPAEWRRRLPRAALVGALTLLAATSVLVPLLRDQWATNASIFNGPGPFTDSYGWRQVGSWARHGDLFDRGRLPVLTVVAVVGLLDALRHWRPGQGGRREAVLLLGSGMVLFTGRNPFGPVIDLLPLAREVFLQRYHVVVHLAGLLLVGLGADAVARAAARAGRHPAAAAWRTRLGPSVARIASGCAAPLALGLLLAPAGIDTARHDAADRRWVQRQAAADRTATRDLARLVAIGRRLGPGRFLAGRLNDWGRDARVGSVPLPIALADQPVDGIGYNLRVASLSADVETFLDDRTARDLRLFGVRWVIAPKDHAVAPGLRRRAAAGDLVLWEVPGSRMLDVVDLVGPSVQAARSALAETTLPVARDDARLGHRAHLVVLDRRSPVLPTRRAGPGSPGRVLGSHVDLDDGRAQATVRLDRPAALVLRANWQPRWHATVDGRPVPVGLSAPTWVSVPVPAGRHVVRIWYRPFPDPLPMLALAPLAVGFGAAAPWWRRRAGQRARRRARTAAAPAQRPVTRPDGSSRASVG